MISDPINPLLYPEENMQEPLDSGIPTGGEHIESSEVKFLKVEEPFGSKDPPTSTGKQSWHSGICNQVTGLRVSKAVLVRIGGVPISSSTKNTPE